MSGLDTQVPLERENFLGCETPQNCSWGWRKILKLRESVRSFLNGKLEMGVGLIYGMIIGIHKGSLVTDLILEQFFLLAAILQLGCLVFLLMVFGSGNSSIYGSKAFTT